MQVILNNKQIIKLIKKHYINQYDVKNCRVSIQAEDIKDKLQEIDLFHYENNYYNIFIRTIITGKIPDKEGVYHEFEEVLNETGLRRMILDSIDNKFTVNDLKFQCQFIEDGTINNQQINFLHAKLEIEKEKVPTLKK